MGLTISDNKTHITHIDDGFDFLGFTLRKYKDKLLIKSSKRNVLFLVIKSRHQHYNKLIGMHFVKKQQT